MKIRFLKNVTVDVETRHGEVYDKGYSRWDEIRVAEVFPSSTYVTVKLENGDILHGVPANSFEQVQEQKRTATL